MNKSKKLLILTTGDSDSVNDEIQNIFSFSTYDKFHISDFYKIQDIAKYCLIIFRISDSVNDYLKQINFIRNHNPECVLWLLLDNFKDDFTNYISNTNIDFVINSAKLDKLALTINSALPNNEDLKTLYKDELEKLEVELTNKYELKIQCIENDKQKLEVSIMSFLNSEKELLDSNSFKSQILENIPALVYIKDAETFRYLYANKAVLDLVGLSNEELIGKTATEIYPDYYAEFLNRTDKEAILNDGKIGIYEEYVKLKDGIEQVLITKKQLIKADDGSPLNILCVSENITDLKITDKKLKKSIQRFSKIFHINNVPILLFEFNSLIITDVNNSFCDLVGYGRQELIGIRLIN